MRTLSASALAIGLVLAPASARAASPAQPSPEPGEALTPEVPRPQAELVPPPPTPIEVDPRNYRMVLAGDILIGLSGAGMIAMAVGLGIRSDAVTQRQALTVSDQPDLDAIARQTRRIETGAQVAITGGVAAAVLLSTGITLVAVGYRRERLRRLSLTGRAPGSGRGRGAEPSLPSASFGPQGASLSWTLRF